MSTSHTATKIMNVADIVRVFFWSFSYSFDRKGLSRIAILLLFSQSLYQQLMISHCSSLVFCHVRKGHNKMTRCYEAASVPLATGICCCSKMISFIGGLCPECYLLWRVVCGRYRACPSYTMVC